MATVIELMRKTRPELPSPPSKGAVAETMRRIQEQRRKVEEALESRKSHRFID